MHKERLDDYSDFTHDRFGHRYYGGTFRGASFGSFDVLVLLPREDARHLQVLHLHHRDRRELAVRRPVLRHADLHAHRADAPALGRPLARLGKVGGEHAAQRARRRAEGG